MRRKRTGEGIVSCKRDILFRQAILHRRRHLQVILLSLCASLAKNFYFLFFVQFFNPSSKVAHNSHVKTPILTTQQPIYTVVHNSHNNTQKIHDTTTNFHEATQNFTLSELRVDAILYFTLTQTKC